MHLQLPICCRRGILTLALAAFLSTISIASFAQVAQFFFNEVDTTESYLSNGFCRTLNYYWDQAVIGPEGNIYFVFVDNYKLYYYVSADQGVTWEKHFVDTGHAGNVYAAMAGMTVDGRLVIVFTFNADFTSSGTVAFGSEFHYTIMGAVQNGESWDVDLIRYPIGNSGLLPFGTITTKSGQVHAILYKYGWMNYGGELFEAIYDPVANSWSELVTIKVFNDRPIDHSTFHVCKLAEGQNDTIICVYQRHANDSKYHNLEVIMKGVDGWTDEEVILEQSDYATYNRFDLDYDRHGHMYFTYFIPYGPEGPELYIAHNSVREFEKHTVFAATDTLRKISVHPYPDGVAYLYLNFKDSLPEIWKLSEDGLEPTGFLPGFEVADSMDVMRFHYQVPIKNNFSVLPGNESADNKTGPGLFAFTNRYAGRDGSTVFPYPLVFVSADLAKDETSEPSSSQPLEETSFRIYPNPGNGMLRLHNRQGEFAALFHIYDITGSRVGSFHLDESGTADLTGLPGGIYFIRNTADGHTLKYVKH
ncbi:MAG: T9SS type A sorting domain-containing protein [Bacteroidales bacterium]|nr:T9SS type A sorting domain-containing protein [Bacteroidales bacterium]MDT8432582.1 T9SS type A sorting domain-containing protein [Bacteroidales bacterium]